MGITEHIAHPLINALGWTLFHSLWQVLLILLLWRLAMLITSKSTSLLRYKLTLWAMLAIPVASAFTFIRQYALYRSARQIVSLEFENMEWFAAAGAQPFYLLNRTQPLALQQYDIYSPYIFWTYLAGLIIVSVLALMDHARLIHLRKKGLKPIPDQWKEHMIQLIRQSGVNENISIWLSTRVDIPAVVGFFKPLILLPLAMLASLTTEQVESIILHELYHVRRKDHYVNAMQTLLEIVFFYHPGMWIISRGLRHEREKCVDEWVVNITGSPAVYARALVSLEKQRSSTAPQPALAATQSQSQLFKRIKHLMTMKTRKIHAGQKMAAMLAILAAFASIAWVNPTKTIDLQYFGSDQPIEHLESPQKFNLSEMLREEVAPDDPPPLIDPENMATEPKTIRLKDGSYIQWQELSQQNRKELERAIEEARITIEREVRDRFQSEEFKREMQKANEAYQKAMEEVMAQFRSDEFQQEMSKLGEEYRKAMEQVQQEFRSEEFQQRMREVGETYRKMGEELREQFQGEEFQAKMRSAGEAHRQTMEELRGWYNMDEFQQELNKAMEELRKAMETLREIDWEEVRKQEEEKRNK